MPDIEPLAAPNTDAWLATYNAVLTGILPGLVNWAARGSAPITDADVDAFVERVQGIAARAATRMHGPLSAATPLPAPSLDTFPGGFLDGP